MQLNMSRTDKAHPGLFHFVPITLAAASLIYAFWIYPSHKENRLWVNIIMAFWSLIPPLYSWLDWRLFGRDMYGDEARYVTHLHDLGRNLWLAMVAVLAYAFGIKPLG
jgi:hypothetical protein